MKKAAVTAIILLIVGAAGYFALQNKAEAEILKSLTAEEIALVLKSEANADRAAIEKIIEKPEARRNFLSAMREYLALAAQARREDFADDENYKINVEYKKNILLADLYRVKLSEGKDKFYVVPEDQIEAVWANAEHEKLFERDMRTLREIQAEAAKASGNPPPPAEFKGEALEKARKNWARTLILSKKAKADAGFMNRAEVALRLKIVEAGILANDYLRANAEKLTANDAEIREYLAAHPEYDVKKKLETAETVLAKARNGEDFDRLAAEYSEDRKTKDKGGLYDEIAEGMLWAEVEKAALELKKGEIADHLIESDAGWHIVKLVDKKQTDKTVLLSVKHILLQKKFEEPGEAVPGIPPPFMTAEEIAGAEILKRKRKEFVGAVVERNPVSLPEDFTLELAPPTIGAANSGE